MWAAETATAASIGVSSATVLRAALSTITPMARRDLKSFVAYKLTSREATFSIKKCIDGTSQIVGKSAVDGSFAKSTVCTAIRLARPKLRDKNW